MNLLHGSGRSSWTCGVDWDRETIEEWKLAAVKEHFAVNTPYIQSFVVNDSHRNDICTASSRENLNHHRFPVKANHKLSLRNALHERELVSVAVDVIPNTDDPRMWINTQSSSQRVLGKVQFLETRANLTQLDQTATLNQDSEKYRRTVDASMDGQAGTYDLKEWSWGVQSNVVIHANHSLQLDSRSRTEKLGIHATKYKELKEVRTRIVVKRSFAVKKFHFIQTPESS
jgi:hypothetical protein